MSAPRTRLHRCVAAVMLATLVTGCSLFGSDDEPVASGSDDRVKKLPVTDTDRTRLSDVRDGGTLRLAVRSLPQNFNPVQVDGLLDDAASVLEPTAGNAVRLADDGSWSVDTDYARSVEVVDEDPLTVEVKLNPQAVWQGGTSITSSDMEAYWKVMSGAESKAEVGTSEGWDDIEDVDKDGKLAYRVVFKEPRSDWPLYVYPRLASVVSEDPAIFNNYFKRRAVSSNGPFVVQSIVEKTGTITLTRNPRWWGAKPRLKSIVFRTATPAVAAKAFVAGELDAVELTEETAPSLVKDAPDDTVVRRTSGTGTSQLTLNAGQGALRDDDVRRAVRLALDRSALATTQSKQLGTQAVMADSLLVAPGQPGYQPGAASSPDLKAAKAALAKSGYSAAKPLTLRLRIPADEPTVASRAAAITTQLKGAGITVEVSTVPARRFYTDVLLPLDFDLTLLTWDGTPLGVRPAELRFRPKDSPLNFTGVADDHAKQWDAASEALDTAARAKAVQALDAALRDEDVSIPLLGVPQVMALRPQVANLGAHALAPVDWTRVGLRAAAKD